MSPHCVSVLFFVLSFKISTRCLDIRKQLDDTLLTYTEFRGSHISISNFLFISRIELRDPASTQLELNIFERILDFTLVKTSFCNCKTVYGLLFLSLTTNADHCPSKEQTGVYKPFLKHSSSTISVIFLKTEQDKL
jgi:hypothetical protein